MKATLFLILICNFVCLGQTSVFKDTYIYSVFENSDHNISKENGKVVFVEKIEKTKKVGFIGKIGKIPEYALDSIKKYTWKENCPIHYSQLAWIELSYWGFDKKIHHDGIIIAHKQHANELLEAFKVLFDNKMPFQSIRPAYEFKGNDALSMKANNTTAFSCREKSGQPGVFSNHSYGTAIDLNPMQNPFIKRGIISPVEAKSYADRTDVRPGMIIYKNAYYNVFKERGWFWGGHWKSSKDYQHFEKAIGGSGDGKIRVGSDRNKKLSKNSHLKVIK